MDRSTRFVIQNGATAPLLLCVEPEAVDVILQEDEEVAVYDSFAQHPVTLRVTRSDSGEAIISIWPGDGDVIVKKDGVDALDLVNVNEAVAPMQSKP